MQRMVGDAIISASLSCPKASLQSKAQSNYRQVTAKSSSDDPMMCKAKANRKSNHRLQTLLQIIFKAMGVWEVEHIRFMRRKKPRAIGKQCDA